MKKKTKLGEDKEEDKIERATAALRVHSTIHIFI